jgi:hypothetical protein
MLNGYKVIIASLIGIIASVLAMFGIEFSIAEQQALGNHLVEVVSGLLAIYFRITATKKLLGVDKALV